MGNDHFDGDIFEYFVLVVSIDTEQKVIKCGSENLSHHNPGRLGSRNDIVQLKINFFINNLKIKYL